MTDPILDELREWFREAARKRLEEMAPLLESVDAEAVRKLARHFHAFAGLGATYGFTRVSELGDEGEASILPLVRSGAMPTDVLVARWQELSAEIRDALERGEPMPVAPPELAKPRRRILAVEDDETHAVLLSHILGNAGYEVAVCSDPGQFDVTLAGFAPDLLLTDVQLAEDDRGGFDLVRRVREDDRFRERFHKLPVIFVSADHHSELVDGDVLVAKPVDWTRLLSLIQSRLP
jgi:CheY-like chemotaxis protein